MTTEPSKTAQAPVAPPEGSPCWIEIMSNDPPKLKSFYEALFPAWSFKPATEQHKDDFMYEFEKPSGLSGGILKMPEGCNRDGEQGMGVGFTVYYFVPSIEKTAKRVEELGGTEVLGKKEIPGGMGWFANFKDLEGNRFGVFENNWEAQCKKE
ncbi:uncharacterized protein BDR25DRAFT_346808 [Lindgomyces ingoldianus]|uniref:Uncharacterized protein n=1 Tax=Lindgomyces ingoldianus TaxID=673940 RepID=A0ACB6QDW4_9PLEO|nr:uncharacterized protein BDR25DRAFT_346808 [Lindgomyces ingoldianus]KAF2464331.1 hypothetical protein BDR25DRAFT_346808 [Lindgomyces ingoldianus]